MVRLSAAFGDPYRNDDAMTRQMQSEWIKAIAGKSARAIEMATDHWIATKTKWPKVAELAEVSDRYLDQATKEISAARNLHPSRVKRPSECIEFNFKQSALRSNLTWYRWLDTKHLMVEHAYFADAQFTEWEHIITVDSAFVQDYISAKFGDELEKTFGRKVFVRLRK